MRHLIIFENFGNYYQNMSAKEAIQKAKLDYNLAMKNDNAGQASKILANLKDHLDSINYDWKTDPYALELLGDYLE